MESTVNDSNVSLFGGRKRDGGRETEQNHKTYTFFKRKERLTRSNKKKKKKKSLFGSPSFKS